MVVPVLSCVHLFIQTFSRLRVGVYHMLEMLSVYTANKTNGESPRSQAEHHEGLLCPHTLQSPPWQVGGPSHLGILSAPRPPSSLSAPGEDRSPSRARQSPPLPGPSPGPATTAKPEPACARESGRSGSKGAAPTELWPQRMCTCSWAERSQGWVLSTGSRAADTEQAACGGAFSQAAELNTQAGEPG